MYPQYREIASNERGRSVVVHPQNACRLEHRWARAIGRGALARTWSFEPNWRYIFYFDSTRNNRFRMVFPYRGPFSSNAKDQNR